MLTLVFGTGFALSCACHAQAHRARHKYGCVLSPDDATLFMDERTDARLYISGNEPMIPRSGDRDFDLALAHTLAAVSEKLEALPSFAYYDDYDGANAYATPKVRMNNADGTVLFGQRLLSRLMSGTESPEVAVAAVCAHEFGHILQFKRGLDRVVGVGQPTVKRVELQADFFAGYFAGARKLERPNFPAAVFAMTQHSFGDNMVNHPGHHGTSEERGAAIAKGFEAAYREKCTLAQAIQISTNYVAGL
ncbi:hypothetical protein [Massilia horti]|nr:hypothetical protein [Massilia horti]